MPTDCRDPGGEVRAITRVCVKYQCVESVYQVCKYRCVSSKVLMDYA